MKYGTVFLLLISVFFFACKNDSSSANDNSGTISGNVVLVDFTGKALANRSGVKLDLVGTTISTTSDSLGNWKFGSVSPGIYSIRYSKPGFGSSREYGVKFSAGGTMSYSGVLLLGAPPAFIPTIDTITANASSVICKSHINNDSASIDQVYSILLINKTATIDPLDSSNFVYVGNIAQVQIAFVTQKLRDAYFISGQKYYARMFCVGGTYASLSDSYVPSAYIDAVTGNVVYTATGPGSNVMSFVMP